MVALPNRAGCQVDSTIGWTTKQPPTDWRGHATYFKRPLRAGEVGLSFLLVILLLKPCLSMTGDNLETQPLQQQHPQPDHVELGRTEKLDAVIGELGAAYHLPEYELLELLRQRTVTALQSASTAEAEVKAIICDLQQQVQLAEQKLKAAEADDLADEQAQLAEASLAEAREVERKLQEEARALEEHVEALGEQLASITTQKEVLSRMDTEQLRTKRELSLFLQLTKTILHSVEPQKNGFVSGSIMLGKDSQNSEIFKVDYKNHSPFEICNYLWDKVSSTDK